MRRMLLSVGLWLASNLASAADYTVGPSDYRDRLGQLQPGDRMILAAGTYERGLPLNGLEGAPGAPIVIEGPSSGPPAVILGRACCNTISFGDSSYIEVRDLELDLRGEFVDGVKAETSGYAHHITVERLYIHGFAAQQQAVGISTKCPAWDWVIRDNRIEGAGTGLYLGNSDGSAPFVRGVVERNLVVDPIGYGMEIKHQNPRPAVAGMPTGDSVTFVRHNVFTKISGASTGGSARPNLLVGHFPPSGAGQGDRYEIYGDPGSAGRSPETAGRGAAESESRKR